MAKSNLGLDDDYVDNDYTGDDNEGTGFVTVPSGTGGSNGRESGDEDEEEEEGGQGHPNGNEEEESEEGAGDDNDEFEGNPHLRGQAEENAGGGDGAPTNDPLTNLYTALGLENGMVDLGDEQVPFNSLDGEQQQLIVTQALQQEREAGRAEALEEELDAVEIDALNVFRQTGRWPDGSAGLPDTAQMSAEDIHRLDIRRDTSLTEDEVEEILEARTKLSSFEKTTANLRTQLAAEIEHEQASTMVEHQQAYITELNTAMAALPISPQGERLIDGWGVAAAAVPDLIAKVGGDPKNPTAIAPFIQELSNPQVLLKLAFYHYYGKDINDAIDRQIAGASGKAKGPRTQQQGQQHSRQQGHRQGPAPETQRQQNTAGAQGRGQFDDLDESFG